MGGTAVKLTIRAGAALRAGDVDMSDLTTATQTGPPRWVDETTLEITFDREPTVAEQALIRRRLLTRDAAHEARATAFVAAAANLGTPDGVAAAVRLLLTEALDGIETLPPLSAPAKTAARSPQSGK